MVPRWLSSLLGRRAEPSSAGSRRPGFARYTKGYNLPGQRRGRNLERMTCGGGPLYLPRRPRGAREARGLGARRLRRQRGPCRRGRAVTALLRISATMKWRPPRAAQAVARQWTSTDTALIDARTRPARSRGAHRTASQPICATASRGCDSAHGSAARPSAAGRGGTPEPRCNTRSGSGAQVACYLGRGKPEVSRDPSSTNIEQRKAVPDGDVRAPRRGPRSRGAAAGAQGSQILWVARTPFCR
jgi:hypothetical protein